MGPRDQASSEDFYYEFSVTDNLKEVLLVVSQVFTITYVEKARCRDGGVIGFD